MNVLSEILDNAMFGKSNLHLDKDQQKLLLRNFVRTSHLVRPTRLSIVAQLATTSRKKRTPP